MTKKEALEFLDLPDAASDLDIRMRLAEKMAYFESLSENSPSVFMRRIHEQNLSKAKSIQAEMASWGVSEPLSATPNPSKSESFVPRPVEQPQILTRERRGPVNAGWLVRHTENKSIKSHPVLPGKTFIGRKAQPGLKPFIEVDDDLFVSRVHAVLNVEGTGPYMFYISDTPASNGGKASTNGTYINGSYEPLNGRMLLSDYDTIQVGQTKFVLRFDIQDILKMQEEVEDRGYMHTVVIKVRE